MCLGTGDDQLGGRRQKSLDGIIPFDGGVNGIKHQRRVFKQSQNLWHICLNIGPAGCETHALIIHRAERQLGGFMIDAATRAAAIGGRGA